jgi:hypothetical protein
VIPLHPTVIINQENTSEIRIKRKEKGTKV